jgi:hypothetical protein
MTKPLPTTGMISVYSGRECLGHVLARGRFGFEGFVVDDRSLGMFRTRADAVTAAAKRGAT